jgi:type IV secretory pathway ATPase VirB11/archaellum biosynthesis ATPase
MLPAMPSPRERLPDRLTAPLSTVFGQTETVCGCQPSFSDEALVVDATGCRHGGRLTESPECREVVVDALTERDVTVVRTETDGIERVYEDEAVALLVAAGRFAEAASFHDERLAARAKRDPLAACREATGRAGPFAAIAAESGLAELTAQAAGYETALAPYIGPTVSQWRVETEPPANAQLRTVRELDTGGTVRHYEPETGPARYYLDPLDRNLSATELSVLATAYDRLATGEFESGDRAPGRAVRAGAEDCPEAVDTEQITAVLQKHTRGYGLLEDLFADPGLSDVFVTAPASANCLRVKVDGERLMTNVRLTTEGVDALSSQFRRESGRAFSRADPTLDATATVASRQVRIAGVTEPPSDGTAFAFRAQDEDIWTLPALVANGTLDSRAAALLSVAVERGGSILLAGPRSAGKTTMLGALTWEVPPAVRTVVIEDTPELPVESLQESGRDVQALRTTLDGEELSPTAALRTALRLGDGALLVGEVRGEEARVLYEAMRVGANSEAVMGTIHGDGGIDVAERVVTDLGVPDSSFCVTDLIVTLEVTDDGDRRVRLIEEVVGSETPSFEALFERTKQGLVPTGRIDRGNSRLVADLTDPEGSYTDLREQITARTRLIEALTNQGGTDGEAVTASHERRDR